MKRPIMLLVFLLLVGTNFAFAQPTPRALEQIRNETTERNRIINNPANNPFNRNTTLSRNGED